MTKLGECVNTYGVNIQNGIKRTAAEAGRFSKENSVKVLTTKKRIFPSFFFLLPHVILLYFPCIHWPLVLPYFDSSLK